MWETLWWSVNERMNDEWRRMWWRDVNEEWSVMRDTRGCESCVRDAMTSNEESVMISVKRREEWELKCGDEGGGEWGGGGEAAERSDITPN